jgi:hypothetical protein
MAGHRYPLEVRPVIPQALTRLEELAGNLLYSWDRRARGLFMRIDPALWEECEHNPTVFLRRVPQERFEALAEDPDQSAAAAAEAADSTDDDDIREALMGFDFRSATGTLIKYQDNGKTEAAGFTGQIHSKEDKPIVYPPEVATGEPIYPKPKWSEF